MFLFIGSNSVQLSVGIVTVLGIYFSKVFASLVLVQVVRKRTFGL